MYVLDCLHEGRSEAQIISNCDGDAQLVKIWMDFIKENGWIVQVGAKRWVLTDKGKEQFVNYYHV
jgi:hypothetical protein